MKKILFHLPLTLIAVLLLMSSCQKSITESTDEVASKATNKPKNECRLTEMNVTLGNYKHRYNSQGLCDEWEISDYGTFKQEYNDAGRLIKSRLYVEDELIYTIDFFYTGPRVTKEIWYYGNSTEVADEVHYTFNHAGQNTRAESFLWDYYTVNSFDAMGNATAWDFYLGGNLTSSGRYKFNLSYKSAFRAIPGIEYGFPFINAAVSTSKFYFSAEKIIEYDENGDPIVIYDYDAQQLPWQTTLQNYPTEAVYHDAVTNDLVTYTMQYENCGPGNESPSRIAPLTSTVNKVKSEKMQLLMKGNLVSARSGKK